MLLQSELEYMKDWRLRKMLRDLRRGRIGNKSHPTGLSRLMEEHYAEEIPRLEREIERRRKVPA